MSTFVLQSVPSDLFNDLHLLFSPLRFVLLGVDEELNHLLLQLICGVWTGQRWTVSDV